MYIRSSILVSMLLFCSCQTADTILYLTRPGNGQTGSQAEMERYYAAFAQNGLPASATLNEWLESRCFNTPGNNKVESNYYNGADLGLGREMSCWECPVGDPNAGLISCAVANHGVPQGLDQFTFLLGDGTFKDVGLDRQASTKSALAALTNFRKVVAAGGAPPLRGAAVVFDFRTDRPDMLRMYIYDANDQKLFSGVNPDRNDPIAGKEKLITGLQLDGEGAALNARVKFMKNCMTCHGGKYDVATDRIIGASFLDFDAILFNYGNDIDPLIALNQDDPNQLTACAKNLSAFTLMGDYVLKVADATGAVMIRDRIEKNVANNYFFQINAKGQCVPDPNNFYVPDGWNKGTVVARLAGVDITDREFFQTTVHKYCASCHFSQVKDLNLHGKGGIPLTFADAEQWFKNENLLDVDLLRQINPAATSVDLIRKVGCASGDMPHAEVTRNNMKRDTKAFAFMCNSEPVPF